MNLDHQRFISFRLHPGQLLKEEIEACITRYHIQAGVLLSVVGGLQNAVLRMAGSDADNQTVKTFDGPFEIVSGTGTISPDGCHIHVSLSDGAGSVIGGHLKGGCIVQYTAEVVIGIVDNATFDRIHDDHTGFDELVVRNQIGFYEGDFYGLSNFSAHQVMYEGVLYATAEHAYQVAKFSDAAQREKIKSAPSPFLARMYGQSSLGRTENFDKVAVMKNIMRAKLKQHDDVREMLLKTGGAEILKNHPGDEGCWGMGLDGRGQNIMGKIWIELRNEIHL